MPKIVNSLTADTMDSTIYWCMHCLFIPMCERINVSLQNMSFYCTQTGNIHDK